MVAEWGKKLRDLDHSRDWNKTSRYSAGGEMVYSLGGWIIQPDAMSAHGGDILVRRIQGSEAIAQPTDQRVQRLV